MGKTRRRTVYRFTLGKVAVILTCQQGVSISPNNAFHIAEIGVSKLPRKHNDETMLTLHSHYRTALPYCQYGGKDERIERKDSPGLQASSNP